MAKATKARARRTANSTFDVARIRADFPVLNRRINRRPLVYLDSAATSQKPAVMIRRINEIYSRDYAKVEEAHFLSRQATKAFRRRAARSRNSSTPPKPAKSSLPEAPPKRSISST
jgi:cysteine desulfurase / selenocysteine lyase